MTRSRRNPMSGFQSTGRACTHPEHELHEGGYCPGCHRRIYPQDRQRASRRRIEKILSSAEECASDQGK